MTAAVIAWREFEAGGCYGFAVEHGLPVVAHVYRTPDDVFGWDVTVGTSAYHHPGVIAGGDAGDDEDPRALAEAALAVWVAEQDARKAVDRLASERWIASGYGEVAS